MTFVCLKSSIKYTLISKQTLNVSANFTVVLPFYQNNLRKNLALVLTSTVLFDPRTSEGALNTSS